MINYLEKLAESRHIQRMKVLKSTIKYLDQATNVFCFLPEEIKLLAVFCHGYTADKSSILNWATRLAEVNCAVALFDLPGHYLGNFSEVEDFDHFKNNAHKLFYSAYEELLSSSNTKASDNLKLVLGGHSLGAMLALKASKLAEFKNLEKVIVGVGIGMAPKTVVHLFDTPFYKNTLDLRNQLVSKALHSDNVFPWIRDEKQNIDLENQRIHLITGIDDLVVGEDGMERFHQVLVEKNNQVTMERPSRLPHHEPNLAASHIKKFLKNINWI